MSEWYYAKGGTQHGPMTSAELKRLYDEGSVAGTDVVWKQGMADWVPAQQLLGATPSISQPIQSQSPAAYAPQAGSMLGYQGSASGVATPRSIEMLRQTRPWVLLFAVLMFIGTGLIALVGLGMVVLGFGIGGSSGAGFASVIGLLYVAMAALYFFPALYLSRYASRIRSLAGSGRNDDLEAALEAQKSFWKFVGVLTVVMFAIYIVIIIGALVGAVGLSGL